MIRFRYFLLLQLYLYSGLIFSGPIFKSDHFIQKLLHNYSEVEKNKCYRFWQLKPSDLENYIKEHKLKIIVNLRGGDDTQKWYSQEQEVAKKNGAVVINAQLSAKEYPSQRSFFILLAIIRNPNAVLKNPAIVDAPIDDLKKVILDPHASEKNDFGYPIPVAYHCFGGADRTGLAIALRTFEHSVGNPRSSKRHILKKALRNLSLRFYHSKRRFPKMSDAIRRWADIRYGRSLADALNQYPWK